VKRDIAPAVLSVLKQCISFCSDQLTGFTSQCIDLFLLLLLLLYLYFCSEIENSLIGLLKCFDSFML